MSIFPFPVGRLRSPRLSNRHDLYQGGQSTPVSETTLEAGNEQDRGYQIPWSCANGPRPTLRSE